MADTDLQAEVDRLVRLVDTLRGNEARLINELFDARQATPKTAPQQRTEGMGQPGLTYADGLREGARLIELWMSNHQVRHAFDGSQNRDATRILFFIPDRLRDFADNNSLPPNFQPPETDAPVPEPITRTERALFHMMLRTCEEGRANPGDHVTELDLASRAFEVSNHYFMGESPVERIVNWRVWIDAWTARAQQAIRSPITEQYIHIDEIDAAKQGYAFINAKAIALGDDGKEILHSDLDNTSAQMPRVKWVALFDKWDNLRGAYILTRDLQNWTQLTIINPPEPKRKWD